VPVNLPKRPASFDDPGYLNVKAQNYIQTLEDRVNQLHTALEKVQWGFQGKRCTVCSGWSSKRGEEQDFKHTRNCVVGKALRGK